MVWSEDEVQPPAGPFEERVTVGYAWHTIDESLLEEACRGPNCWQKATHKVADADPAPTCHPLTTYLCCGCMQAIGMNCRHYAQ